VAGERLAAWWLTEQGLRVVERNVAIDGGEIDLIAVDGARRVAVEVRTITGIGDPIDAIDTSKRRHVLGLAARAGISRVDFVGVAISDAGLLVHWLPG
jgi:putative endonuclease